MRKLYLLDLGISDCEPRKVDRFYAIMASFYTWSLRLFGNAMLIQTEDIPNVIEWTLHECATRIEKEETAHPSLFEGPESGYRGFPIAIEDFAICEIVDHVIYLKDKEKAKLLEEMFRDSNIQST